MLAARDSSGVGLERMKEERWVGSPSMKEKDDSAKEGREGGWLEAEVDALGVVVDWGGDGGWGGEVVEMVGTVDLSVEDVGCAGSEDGGLGVRVVDVAVVVDGAGACSFVSVVALGGGCSGAAAAAGFGGSSSCNCFFSTAGEVGGIGMSVSARYTETNWILASAVLKRSSPCMFGWVLSAFHLRRVSCAVSSIAERALFRSSNFLRRSSRSDWPSDWDFSVPIEVCWTSTLALREWPPACNCSIFLRASPTAPRRAFETF